MTVKTRTFVAMLACCIAASAVIVAQASAGRSFQERFHNEGTVEIESFCGAAGLTVSDEFVIDARLHVVSRGRDGLEYVLENLKETERITNLANGRTVTLVNTVTRKDLKLTFNGDGTLTALTLGTGNTVLYGADGKAIARNPGQLRERFLVDLGGTPNDPSDDEVISAERVKGSTGRTDDVCAAAVDALT